MGFQNIKIFLKLDKQNSSYKHLKLVLYMLFNNCFFLSFWAKNILFIYIQIDSEGGLHDLLYPMTGKELKIVQDKVVEEAIESYQWVSMGAYIIRCLVTVAISHRKTVGHLSDDPSFQRQLEQLKVLYC